MNQSVLAILLVSCLVLCTPRLDSVAASDIPDIDLDRGVLSAVCLSDAELSSFIQSCAEKNWVVFYQTNDLDQLELAKKLAAEHKVLGERFFAAQGNQKRLQLADNIADFIYVGESPGTRIGRDEILRALRPHGTALIDGQTISKPRPDGVDDWTHPYHGPDNNPQSNDQLVKGSFRTQFIGDPMFSPMPEQTVIANGRIFKAMGHIAHKANQNAMLNTLLCINAYNGSVLWRRDLPEGFMLHRNTMIATDESLLLGDRDSCKFIDASTGEITREIKVDPKLSDGPVWKWMALRDGILYALVGNNEVQVETQRSLRRGLGHWPWGMWEGHAYDDPKTSFGFGRTLLAIDVKSGKNKWHYRTSEFIDARAICMNERHLFCYSPENSLTAIDCETGKEAWKNETENLLEAIGGNQKAQHYITGYATTCYMKCSTNQIFFAGPQRSQTVAASAVDGNLLWTYPIGNLQLVLRDDGVWAAGPQKSENGVRLSYETGEVLSTFPARRACTRATGCADSIFFRASGGTVRVLTENNTAQHLDPMRPPCQDGVLIAGGHLYWGPWMCGCQLSLYGNIGLRPQSEEPFQESESPLWTTKLDDTSKSKIHPQHGDWSTYRGSNARTDRSLVPIPKNVEVLWSKQVCEDIIPTSATTANGMVFVADRRGCIQAFDENGQRAWTQSTDGPIYYPPTVANGKLFVGSADGKAYAFDASSGNPLWNYRVGPNLDRIPIFDRLLASWPLSGGVVAEGNTVYAAAGLTHYDGTYVVALDAATGELKAENRTSGVLQADVNNGVSMQGELSIVDGELRFLAGGVYETARYDLKTLECLNAPLKQVESQYRTAFYPYYPEYGKYLSLEYQCADGCKLSHDASYEGSLFVNLAKYSKPPSGAPKIKKEAARWVRRGGKLPEPVWQDQANRRFTCFAVTDETILAGGHPEGSETEPFLVAIDTNTGQDLWLAPLPSLPVKGGISVGFDGRLYAMLENGRLLCFVPRQ